MKKILIFLLLLAAMYIIYNYHSNFYQYSIHTSFDFHWKQIESLREIASITFGVFGLWLAVVYPGKLTNILRATSSEVREAEFREISYLFYAMILTSFVIFIILIYGYFALFLSGISLSLVFKGYLKAGSLCLLIVLSIAEIVSVFLAISPAFSLLFSFQNARERNDINQKMQINVQKE